MERFDRREAHLRARQLAIKYKESPGINALYGLYQGLEHDYLNWMERAIRAESKWDKVRQLIGKEDGTDGTERFEREAAGGDLCAGEGGGTG